MDNNRHNRTLGQRGEDAVCRALMDAGHTILERNWRGGHLEIDIISLDRNGIHFVEVKSRVAPVAAAPQESVTKVKQRRITEAARRYINSGSRVLEGGCECHFDVAAVVFEDGKESVTIFEDAYVPGI